MQRVPSFPPATASVVADIEDFVWTDDVWMKERKNYADRKQPLSIYETGLPEWKSAENLAAFVKELGYTHVELHPVMEYLDESTGGYSTFAYYAPTKRFGTPGNSGS